MSRRGAQRDDERLLGIARRMAADTGADGALAHHRDLADLAGAAGLEQLGAGDLQVVGG